MYFYESTIGLADHYLLPRIKNSAVLKDGGDCSIKSASGDQHDDLFFD